MGPFHHGFGFGGGGMIIGGVLLLLVVSALIILAVLFFAGVFRRRAPTPQHGGAPRGEEDALQILKRRYARGEISKEEYQEMRTTLTERHDSGTGGAT